MWPVDCQTPKPTKAGMDLVWMIDGDNEVSQSALVVEQSTQNPETNRLQLNQFYAIWGLYGKKQQCAKK